MSPELKEKMSEEKKLETNEEETQETELDYKKLESKFKQGIGKIYSKLKAIELKSAKEISEMSFDEFYGELDNLDKQYEKIIKQISQ